MRFKIPLARLLSGVVAFTAASAAAIDLQVWEGATNPQTRERYIPVELWSGAEWDGKRELQMPKVAAIYVHRSRYEIKGPKEWKHTATGETLLVYERTNPGRDGTKLQLFAINQERSGLGGVYDARPGLGLRVFSGGMKFPLGYWKEGETRKFLYNQFEDGKASDRAESIAIRRIDFEFQGMQHCLEFDWAATDREEKRFYDRQLYIYCPGKSMISEIPQ